MAPLNPGHPDAPSRAPSRARSRRAFTLLEVVLATAILAAVSTLAAMMFAQARSWNEANASHMKTMRLARATELMTRQWADRRSAVPVDPAGAKVIAEPEALRFVTATPLLHRGWPLVIATYRIEPDQSGPFGERRSQLIYEETRVSHLGTTGEARESQFKNPATEDEAPFRTVLLSRLGDLRFDRFGPRLSPEDLQLAVTNHEPVDQERDLAPRWWAYEKLIKGTIPAVRIVGEHEGKEFACVFVIERSRS